MTQPDPRTPSSPHTTGQPPWPDGVVRVPRNPSPAHRHRAQRTGGPPPEPKRPAAVWVVSIILAVFGLLGIAFSLVVLSDLGSHGEDVNPAVRVILYAQLLLSATQIASGLAVLPGYRTARLLAITVCVLNVTGGFIVLLSGAVTAIAGIAINGILIQRLNTDGVRDWCDRRSTPSY
jgi:hypothetical protein